MKQREFSSVDYGVRVPDALRGRGRFERSEEYYKIIEFVQSEHDTMRFVYDTVKRARSRCQSLAVTIKRECIPVRMFVRKNELYIGSADAK